MMVERNVLLGRDAPPRGFGNTARHLVEQAIDDFAAGYRFADDIGDVVRFDAAV